MTIKPDKIKMNYNIISNECAKTHIDKVQYCNINMYGYVKYICESKNKLGTLLPHDNNTVC